MTSYHLLLTNALTDKEKVKVARLESIQKKIVDKQAKLEKRIKELETEHCVLGNKIGDIREKALKRYRNKCPHRDISGPSHCARDDCSGNHYHCQQCGKGEFSIEAIKAKEK